MLRERIDAPLYGLRTWRRPRLRSWAACLVLMPCSRWMAPFKACVIRADRGRCGAAGRHVWRLGWYFKGRSARLVEEDGESASGTRRRTGVARSSFGKRRRGA